MTFIQALNKMKQGHKVQAGWWLKYDYLYIEKGKIMCDGGFEFTSYLTFRELKTKTWRVVK